MLGTIILEWAFDMHSSKQARCLNISFLEKTIEAPGRDRAEI